MTNIERAIRDAVEKGGYQPVGFEPVWPQEQGEDIWFFEILEGDVKRKPRTMRVAIATILMERDFWQALGKVYGWSNALSQNYDKIDRAGWRLVQHRFIDHLAEGKDAESFFKDLSPTPSERDGGN